MTETTIDQIKLAVLIAGIVAMFGIMGGCCSRTPAAPNGGLYPNVWNAPRATIP